jgi:hypothetical protein
MQKNSTTLILAAIVTMAVVTTAKQFIRSKKCDPQTAVLQIDKVTLPYKTHTGTMLSADGIPRGKYRISTNSDISQIEVSAVMLDPNQNLIKTVVMIGGNFADDAGFELTDSPIRGDKPVKAKILERISLLPVGSGSKFSYLFAPPESTRWNASKVVTIELDDTIAISQLHIRKLGSVDNSWIEANFVRTNERIPAQYARKNTVTPQELKASSYTYGLPGCQEN